ncbi:MAG: cyanoexosortase B system-associated protein [Cyanobacteria bacterium J06634_5]
MTSSTFPIKLHKKSIAKLAIVLALALFVALSALPRYMDGWPWADPPRLTQAERTALQALPEKGIALSGWTVGQQTSTKLGGNAWSIQQLSPDTASENETVRAIAREGIPAVYVLLRPQIYGGDQPEVEWIDIKGSQKWTTDSQQNLTFEIKKQKKAEDSTKDLKSDSQSVETVRINSDFFRAWNKGQTYAILQWYAWPTGGSASPARWFWADQKIQWNQYQRMPWVAVSLWIPIEPLGDIGPYESMAQSLGRDLHQTLLQTVFNETADSRSSD